MDKKIFFNSSLPRSMSTLLQNTMGQNPEFYVTPTSGLLELLFSARINYTNSLEFKAQDKEEMQNAWLGFCRGAMHGYFNNLTHRNYVIDKSRGWGIHSDFLHSVLDEPPKIICMVRNLRCIVSSLEKIHRQTEKTKSSGIVDHSSMQNTSVFKRVNTFLATQPLGLALERLEEIFRQGLSKYIYFVRAEDFTQQPKEVLQGVYNFLELPYYEDHDFDNIPQLTTEDDEVYGLTNNLHSINKKIIPLRDDSQEVLGVDICNWIDSNPNLDWYNKLFKYNQYAV
jgi:sulfotransferase